MSRGRLAVSSGIPRSAAPVCIFCQCRLQPVGTAERRCSGNAGVVCSYKGSLRGGLTKLNFGRPTGLER